MIEEPTAVSYIRARSCTICCKAKEAVIPLTKATITTKSLQSQMTNNAKLIQTRNKVPMRKQKEHRGGAFSKISKSKRRTSAGATRTRTSEPMQSIHITCNTGRLNAALSSRHNHIKKQQKREDATPLPECDASGTDHKCLLLVAEYNLRSSFNQMTILPVLCTLLGSQQSPFARWLRFHHRNGCRCLHLLPLLPHARLNPSTPYRSHSFVR